jgi:hypothetical protein
VPIADGATVYVVDLDGASLDLIDKGASAMAKTTSSTTTSEKPSSSDARTTKDQTASNETAREKYIRKSLTDPRFKMLQPSGKTFAIVGSHLTKLKDST